MKIKNKVAIVTGGGSGLGLATVQRFVEQGCKVAIFDLNTAAGDKVVKRFGNQVMFCQVDVTDDGSIATGIDSVMASFGAIHICVNCAGRGGGATKTLSRKGSFPMDLFRNVVNINLLGTFSVLSQAAEKMSLNQPNDDGERGVIINTASIAAYDGQKGQAAYAASKGGIVSLTLPIARDLAYYGIRVVTIAPGLFDTPLLKGLPDDVKQNLTKDVPNPSRLGHVCEFASLAEHIVANSYINGETIRLDGALRMP